MLDKMKQIWEMKRQADQLKKQLEALTVASQEVQGIKIMINGALEVQSIEIDESVLKTLPKSKLEMELRRSVNAAIKKSQNLAAEKMKDMLPGFPGL